MYLVHVDRHIYITFEYNIKIFVQNIVLRRFIKEKLLNQLSQKLIQISMYLHVEENRAAIPFAYNRKLYKLQNQLKQNTKQ